MKINIYTIGKTQDRFINEGIEYYLKKIRPMSNIEWIKLNVKQKSNDVSVIKKTEEDAFLKRIKTNEYICLLDENGKTFKSSRDFSSWIEKKQLSSIKSLNFCIGGAFGFSQAMYGLANEKVSLSSLTLSHQIVRLVLLEQIYRGYAILNNHPYHND